MRKAKLILASFLALILAAGAFGCSGPGATTAPAPTAKPSPAPSPAPAPTPTAKPSPAPSPTPAPAKVITLSFADTSPAEAHSRTDIMSQYFRDIEAYSKGRVKIDEYWAGTLGGSQTLLESVQAGLIDIGTIQKNSYPTQMLEWNFSDLVFLLPSKDIVAGIKAMNETEAKYGLPQMLNKKYNQKTLWTLINSDYGMLANKPIRKFTDLKGMKIRASGAYGQVVQAAGGVLISIAGEGVYEALMRGVIDGVAGSIEGNYRFKRHEAVKYFSRIGMGCLMNMRLNINLDTWNKLPPDIQKFMLDTASKYEPDAAKQIIDWEWQYAGIPMEQAGVKFNDLDPGEFEKFKATAGPIWEKWIADAAKTGLPAKQLFADYQAALEKYKK